MKIKRKNSPKPPISTTPQESLLILLLGRLIPEQTQLDVIPDGGQILSYEGPEADRTDPMVPPDGRIAGFGSGRNGCHGRHRASADRKKEFGRSEGGGKLAA